MYWAYRNFRVCVIWTYVVLGFLQNWLKSCGGFGHWTFICLLIDVGILAIPVWGCIVWC